MTYDLVWLNLTAVQQESLTVLLDRIRRHFVTTLGEVRGAVSVPSASAPELWRLCNGMDRGRRVSTTATVKIRLADVDQWLRDRGGDGLRATVGPLRFPRLESAQRQERRSAAVDAARALLPAQEWVERWLDDPAVRRGDVVTAARVLALLPADGIVLTALAERATGDTKALSTGSISRLVLRALAYRFDQPETADPRDLWARAGVVVNAVSSRALIRGVTMQPTSPAAEWINAARGEPFVVTLDQVLRHRLTPAVDVLYVCENPAVLESLPPGGPPLLCTEGQPSVAAARLLAATTAPIWWRGDFDWTGVRTTRTAIDRYGARPWLMDAETYRDGLKLGDSERFKPGDRPAETPWDPALSVAMAEAGRAVMEERLIDTLRAGWPPHPVPL